MDSPLEITVYHEDMVAFRDTIASAVEFGRRKNETEPEPYRQHLHDGVLRVIIAALNETDIPRQLVRAEPIGAAQARLTNVSKLHLDLDTGPALEPGAARDVGLPITILIGGKAIALHRDGAPPDEFQSLAGSVFMPNADPDASQLIASVAKGRMAEGKLDNETLLQWIQASLTVLQSAVGTTEFFGRAAHTLVNQFGLDVGCVLLPEADRWAPNPESMAGQAGSAALSGEWQPSRQVLRLVIRDKKTFWTSLASTAPDDSLHGVQAVVASPIVSARGEVIGILYGERRRGGPEAPTISRLVAMLVEMLAGCVAAGLARLEQERTQFLWEQFVTPELSRHLAGNPSLMAGRDVDVTMLSADIRGFSRICDQLGPARTLDWVQDVLGTLSDCVLGEEGVLVDYVGDELLAMWGAPALQPNHAARACRAARAMLAAVPVLNSRWLETVRQEMGIGIGISSGTARVGNVGSKRKFKYGALGTTVNLASRVQGATRAFDVPALITGAVRARIAADFPVRRLSQIEVVNIPNPVTVYQLAGPDAADWDDLCRGYEQALAHFENREFRPAARLLGALLAQPAHRDDSPSLLLLHRAVTCLVEKEASFSPVWRLEKKK
jgi:adenylate cyclase